ncbi:MBOAT family protein [Alteraurantiacibacter aestuarii]|uniref:MBOAT family O-acyltransferase n=1 Tax=Alteraurantiacibacter aestuarii TaxID=650004 RepID=UPI0031D074D9
MNFASAPFLLIFLPLVLVVFHAIRGERAGEWRMAFLTLASALFYVSSGWQNALVLGSSIAVNFGCAKMMMAANEGHVKRRKAIMWLAVIFNVGLLLTFKLTILAADSPDGFNAAEDVLLPLALSFVTFQQIGFITSVQKRTITQITLRRYLFFVLFFPQLVLGPIIRFEDVKQQLDDGALVHVDPRWVATGLAIFSLALFKKLALADPLGRAATRVFDATLTGPVPLGDAWFAITTFQFQLFFDFTAYAEMAIGLAMMHGMRVPLNFDRPLFARDRADLWRRWHISFTTFMRGNVFLPLVRRWKWPVWAALAMTGILSGLWHGLGATFVIWGLLQTAILLWLHARATSRRASGRRPLPIPLAIALTFLTTCLIGALFRAPDIIAAQHIYTSLLGAGGWHGGQSLVTLSQLAMAIMAALLIWAAPDFGQLFRNHWQYTELRPTAAKPPRHWIEGVLPFRLNRAWGVICALAVVIALTLLARQVGATRFVYVQF